MPPILKKKKVTKAHHVTSINISAVSDWDTKTRYMTKLENDHAFSIEILPK